MLNANKLRQQHEVAFALTDYECHVLATCSIERVIKQSTHLLSKSRSNEAGDNLQDWCECEQLVVKLWNAARNLNTIDQMIKQGLAE